MSAPAGPSWKQGIASVLALALMVCLDYATGPELFFSAAYLLPVAICAWRFGFRAILCMALAGGLATFAVDWIDGYSFSHWAIHYWNSVTCFVISLLVGVMLRRLKLAMAERDKSNMELRKALSELEKSTAEIRKLQGGLQVVCAWTKQIQVNGKWMTPDEFLTTQLNLKLTHGISPEGERLFLGEDGEAPKKAANPGERAA